MPDCRTHHAVAIAVLALTSTVCQVALAQANAAPTASSTEATDFFITAQPLDQALNQLARQAGLQLLAPPALLQGRQGEAVQGRLSVGAAATRLLAGSGLVGRLSGNTLVIERAAASGATLPVVTVTADEGESPAGHVSGYLARRSTTGTKTDTPVVETPQSISIVTADRIEAQGATTLKDALGYSPGVSTTSYGADSRYDWISLRGFDAYAPGFYLDGLPLRNNGNWGVWQTENYGVERIELLRGPSSVLYGQSGPGGVVNVVGKRPTAEPLHELQAQVGTGSRRQVSGDFSGPLDKEGKLLYRITGLGRDAELPAGNMPDDRIYLAPSLTWRPSSDTTLTLLSHYIRTRAGSYTRGRPAVGSLVPTAAGTTIPSSLFTGEPDFNHYDQDQWTLGYQLEHRFDDTWTVRQNLRYGRLDVDYGAVTARRFIAVNGNAADPANDRRLVRTSSGSVETVTSFTVDNQVEAKLRLGGLQHKVLLGLDHQRTRIDQFSYSGGSAPSLDVLAPEYGGAVSIPAPWMDAVSRLAQTGLYVQDQIKWNDAWVVTLGGRYDSATSTVRSRLDGSVTRVPDDKFTGRAGLVYLAPNGWAPYLSYSQSFVPTATLDAETGGPLKPETGRQYEAGLRYQPPGRKDSYSAAVFDLRRQNYITYDTNFLPRQTGEVVVRGLELEATLQPISRLNLTAAYAWTPKADVIASSRPEEIGKQLTAVPRHRLSLWTDYRFETGIKVGLGARYTGSNRGDGELAPAKVPAFTVFDAMVGYDFSRWSLALNVRNLGNKTYIANCDAYGNCYYGDERKVIATATYRW